MEYGVWSVELENPNDQVTNKLSKLLDTSLYSVSTHLLVKKSERKKEDNVFFVMGDLNYILNYSSEINKNTILDSLLKTNTRLKLLNDYDSFDANHFKSLNLIWSSFDSNNSLPTYKN